MKHKEKKITLDDLADELMFEVYKTMFFRNFPEEGNMKNTFKKFFRKAIKLNNKNNNDEPDTANSN